jgi:hypothetical protein
MPAPEQTIALFAQSSPTASMTSSHEKIRGTPAASLRPKPSRLAAFALCHELIHQRVT